MTNEQRRIPRAANGRPVVMGYPRRGGRATADNPYPDLNSAARAIEQRQGRRFDPSLDLPDPALQPAYCGPGGPDEIDRLAQQISDKIGQIPDSKHWEYYASLFRDKDGRLRSTDIRKLTNADGGLAPKPDGWVADVHNHPEGPGRQMAELAFDRDFADKLFKGIADGTNYDPTDIARQKEAYVQNYLQHDMAGPGRPSVPGRKGDGDADRIVEGGRSYIRNYDHILRCFEPAPPMRLRPPAPRR